MARQSLQQRVETLETQMDKLQVEMRLDKPKDWRRTIGAFTDDRGMRRILQEALRQREADRKKVRATRGTKRKTGR